MSQSLEPLYEKLHQNIWDEIPVLDPDIAVRVMQITKSLEKTSSIGAKPHVCPDVKYKDGVGLHAMEGERAV